jgi:hypothetical protein
VRFEVPAALDVAVRDERGAPVEGAEVRLFCAASDVALLPGGRTDAAGRLRLRVYAAEEADVRVRTSERAVFRSAGAFDPGGGDGRIDATVPAGRDVVLHVSPEPRDLDLFVGPVRLATREVERRGALFRFTARPERGGGPAVVHLLAPGFVPSTLEVDVGDPAPAEFRVRLEPAGRLTVHLVLGGERQPYRLVLLDGRDDAAALRRGSWAFRLYPGPDHVVRETMLPPGVYRVKDLVSGVATAAFEVGPGRMEADLRLDLAEAPSHAAPEVQGVVPGFVPGTEVLATIDGDPERAVALDGAGAFRLPWPGRGALVLRARHPGAAAGPAVTLLEPRRDLVLHPAPRCSAVVRLVPAPPAFRDGGTEPSVVLQAGARATRLDANLAGDRLGFVGFQPGRYDLRVDLPGLRPCLLRDVELGEGENDLGTLELRAGSTLRLHVVGRDREALPALTVSAQAETPPRYQRSLRTDGAERAQLAGLGAGPFRVTAWDRLTGQLLWSDRIEVDGESDLDLEIDVR